MLLCYTALGLIVTLHFNPHDLNLNEIVMLSFKDLLIILF